MLLRTIQLLFTTRGWTHCNISEAKVALVISISRWNIHDNALRRRVWSLVTNTSQTLLQCDKGWSAEPHT